MTGEQKAPISYSPIVLILSLIPTMKCLYADPISGHSTWPAFTTVGRKGGVNFQI